jgi:hypothetical protein
MMVNYYFKKDFLVVRLRRKESEYFYCIIFVFQKKRFIVSKINISIF